MDICAKCGEAIANREMVELLDEKGPYPQGLAGRFHPACARIALWCSLLAESKRVPSDRAEYMRLVLDTKRISDALLSDDPSAARLTLRPRPG